MNLLKCTLALGLALCALSLQAQDLIPVKNKKDKWGYQDSDGNMAINYKYNEALAFVDGRAKVRKGDKWGYINTSGDEIIPIKYTEIGTWNDNRAKVAVGGKVQDGNVTGAKYGYISSAGDILVKPEYDKIGPFENGMAYVVKGGKYGYIDEHFAFIIKPDYSAIGKFNPQGYCWVAKNGKIQDGKIANCAFGVVNRQGEIIVKPEYSKLGTFCKQIEESNPMFAKMANNAESREKFKKAVKEASKGLGKMSFMAGLTGDKQDLIDETNKRSQKATMKYMSVLKSDLSYGDSIIYHEAPRWDLLGYEFIDGKLFSELDMSVSDYFAVSKAGYIAVTDKEMPWLISLRALDKIGIIDKYGKILVKNGQYPIAFLPSEGLIPVAKSTKKCLEVNYLKPDGKLLFKKWAKSSAVSPFVNGTAVIADGDNQYIVDKSGNIISSTYRFILPQQNGTHIVAGTDGYGLVDSQGKEIAPTSWNLIVPADNGIHCARKESNGLFGYIDDKGNYIINPTYVDGRSFKGQTAPVKSEQGWGLINPDNQTVVECKWSDILPLSTNSDNLCWVKQGDQWHCLDTASKNFAFDAAFSKVNNFDESNLAVVANGAGMYGCIDRAGKMLIPTRLSDSKVVKLCLEYMKTNSLDHLTDIQAHRFNLDNNPARNGFRLSNTIDNTMWSY